MIIAVICIIVVLLIIILWAVFTNNSLIAKRTGSSNAEAVSAWSSNRGMT